MARRGRGARPRRPRDEGGRGADEGRRKRRPRAERGEKADPPPKRGKARPKKSKKGELRAAEPAPMRTFKSRASKAVNVSEVIELQPFKGAVRESQVIKVQPLARASKGSKSILFGEIARDCGFVDQRSLDLCVRDQKRKENAEERAFIGDILVDKALLTRQEVAQILEIQARNLQKRYKYTGDTREEALFGKLVVKRKIATKAQVDECVRWQAEMARLEQKVPLGELLIARGYANDEDVELVLRKQARGVTKKTEHANKEKGDDKAADKNADKGDDASASGRRRRRRRKDRDADEDGGRRRRRSKRDAATVDEAEVPETDEAPRKKKKKKRRKTADAADAGGEQPAADKKQRRRRSRRMEAHTSSREVDAVTDEAEGSAKRSRRSRRSNRAVPLESASGLDADRGADSGTRPAVARGWYLGLLGRAYGPMPRRLIALLFEEAVFGPDDIFWHHELDGWMMARFIDEFTVTGASKATAGGPPLPLQVRSPKALGARLDALREDGALAQSDHVKLRKLLSRPYLPAE